MMCVGTSSYSALVSNSRGLVDGVVGQMAVGILCSRNTKLMSAKYGYRHKSVSKVSQLIPAAQCCAMLRNAAQ